MSRPNQRALAESNRRSLIEYGPYYPSEKAQLARQSDADVIELYDRLRGSGQITDVSEDNLIIKTILFMKMPYSACERKSVVFWNKRARLVRTSRTRRHMLKQYEKDLANLHGESAHAQAIKMAKYGCSPSGERAAVPEEPEVAERHMAEADAFDRRRSWMKQADNSGCSWLADVIAEGWIENLEAAAGIMVGKMHGCGAFGCVFEIAAPENMRHYALKITSDQTEGPNQAFIMQHQRVRLTKKGTIQLADIEGAMRRQTMSKERGAIIQWMRKAFTIVHTVAEKGDQILAQDPVFGLYRDTTVYAIIREDIKPLTDWGSCFPPPEGATAGRSYSKQECDDLTLALHNYRTQASLAKDALLESTDLGNDPETRKGERSEFHRRVAIAGELLKEVGRLSDTLMQGLIAWSRAGGTKRHPLGAPLADVHIGNVGWRKWPEFGEVGDLVIFDPGYTVSPAAQRKKVTRRIREINPGGGPMDHVISDWFERRVTEDEAEFAQRAKRLVAEELAATPAQLRRWRAEERAIDRGESRA